MSRRRRGLVDDLLRHRRSLGWSAGYLVVTRVSTLAAVPLLLTGLGADLYVAWVLAGTLVTAQAMLDLGLGAALVRFVSAGTAQDSRAAVVGAMWRSAAFYAGVSAVIGMPLWLLAPELALAMPAIDVAQQADATTLLRYAVAMFAVSNLVLVLGSSLQGMDRVDEAFRGRTLGWLAYLPSLAVGGAIADDVHAAGVAWLVAGGLQVTLLARPTRAAVRRVGAGIAPPPRFAEMLSLGARWQVSSWADLATFQLPRLLGGLALPAGELIAIDLSLRYAQTVVMPAFAALPLVLPRASAAWTRQGMAGLRALMDRLMPPFCTVMAVGTAVAVPLGVPAIEAWTGYSLGRHGPAIVAAVALGISAHASTGLLSSALLAAGTLRAVIVYKALQLALALLALAAVAQSGSGLVAGIGVGVALAVPAFIRLASRELASRALPAGGGAARLVTAVAASAAATLAGVEVGWAVGGPWAQLALGLALGAPAASYGLAWTLGRGALGGQPA